VGVWRAAESIGRAGRNRRDIFMSQKLYTIRIVGNWRRCWQHGAGDKPASWKPWRHSIKLAKFKLISTRSEA
jgi:hypothetical protein